MCVRIYPSTCVCVVLPLLHTHTHTYTPPRTLSFGDEYRPVRLRIEMEEFHQSGTNPFAFDQSLNTRYGRGVVREQDVHVSEAVPLMWTVHNDIIIILITHPSS